jgi:hypothetical protein
MAPAYRRAASGGILRLAVRHAVSIILDLMFRRFLSGILVLALALGSASALALDPLVLLLLRSLRDHIAMAAAEAGWDTANRPSPPQFSGYLNPPQNKLAPGTEPEETRLRALIDGSFSYLSADQREQVFAGLMKILANPENSAMRPQIVASFTQTAEAVGAAQRAFGRLTPAEKQALRAQARIEYLGLPPEERRQMVDILRAGHAPLPQDLREMMLTEFSAAEVGDGYRDD